MRCRTRTFRIGEFGAERPGDGPCAAMGRRNCWLLAATTGPYRVCARHFSLSILRPVPPSMNVRSEMIFKGSCQPAYGLMREPMCLESSSGAVPRSFITATTDWAVSGLMRTPYSLLRNSLKSFIVNRHLRPALPT